MARRSSPFRPTNPALNNGPLATAFAGNGAGTGYAPPRADGGPVWPQDDVLDAPPPAFITVGEAEILRDDAIRMAERLRANGGEVEMSVVPDVPHAWQFFGPYLPEARASMEAAAAFIKTRLGATAVVARDP